MFFLLTLYPLDNYRLLENLRQGKKCISFFKGKISGALQKSKVDLNPNIGKRIYLLIYFN